MRKLFILAAVASALTACGGVEHTPPASPTPIALPSNPNFTKESNATQTFEGQAQNYSSYGVVTDIKTSKYDVYVKGSKITPEHNLQTLSTARYEGFVVRADAMGKAKVVGNSVLDVNFSTKRVAGKLDISSQETLSNDITLSDGKLDKASFTGVAMVDGTTAHVGTFSGNLYGDQAEEAAGIVKFSDAAAIYNAAFGGKR